MTTALQLRELIRSGIHRIGQVEILTEVYGYPYVLCHVDDIHLATEPAFGGLDLHEKPDAARDLSTWAEDGTYRFTKGQTNLRRGWVIALEDEESLRLALDLLYPACVGLFLAQRKGTLEVENLRDKLGRQTGMYRNARNISDEGAQTLVQKVCGPAHRCAKRILWQLDEATPLADSEASRYDGIPAGLSEIEAIPLLCREACNHFVAECRKVSKAEYDARTAAGAS
jgi:hypothetical protein